MVKIKTLNFQRILPPQVLYLLFILSFPCQVLWAAQDAMVVSEKAVIYSDKEMTSPIGFVRRGKKLKVGEVPRNKAQVYPIVVSGKVAFIRVFDVTTEKESMNSDRLVAERFQKNTQTVYQSRYSLSYYRFNSLIDIKQGTTGMSDEVPWTGASLKGEVFLKQRFDLQILVNYMMAEVHDADFRVAEFGLGGAYRLIETRKFQLGLEAQLLSVPFASYAVKDDFRVNSYGYTVGAGFSANYRFGENWGAEASAGLYQTKLFEFDAPAPYTDIAPKFTGSRVRFGVNYTY